jgi:hypothetical protein
MRSMGMRSPTAIADSLSGKVSTEALTALTTLMNAHKAEMDAMRSQASTLTPEQKQVKQVSDQVTLPGSLSGLGTVAVHSLLAP